MVSKIISRPIEAVRLRDVQRHVKELMDKYGDCHTNVIQITEVGPRDCEERKVLFHVRKENDYGIY